MNGRRSPWRLFFALALLALAAGRAAASDPPHSTLNLTNGCNDCHVSHNAPGLELTKSAGNANLCTSCHQTRGFTTWYPTDQAVPGVSGTMHSWSGAVKNPVYGAQAPASSAITTHLEGTAPNQTLTCSGCHDQHMQTNPSFDPRSPTTAGQAGRHLMRMDNSRNGLCVDCHAPWNKPNAKTNTFATTPGTATFTAGGTTVTGASTTWVGQVQPGWQIKRQADPATAFTFVKSVDSNTQITLATGYKGTAGSAVAWEAGGTVSHPVGVAFSASDANLNAAPMEVSGTTVAATVAQVKGFWGAATSGTTTTLVDTSKTFTGSVNLFVRFTSGLNVTQAPQKITAVPATNTVQWATALPYAVAAGDKYEIDADGNVTNNVVLENAGTPAYNTGNVWCMSCHGVHYADSKSTTYDTTPPGTGNGLLLRRENDDRSCLGCHPATMDHNSTNTQSTRPAWGTTFGCRTCHAPHQGTNLHLLARLIPTPYNGNAVIDLRSHTTGQEPFGLVDGPVTGAPPTTGKGPCEACHTDTRNGTLSAGTGTIAVTAGSTTVTGTGTSFTSALVGMTLRVVGQASTAWTRVATVASATSLSLSVGYKGATASGATWESSNPRYRNDGSGRGAVGTEHYTSDCMGCHSHAKAFAAGESGGATNCSGCHSQIWQGMTGIVAKATKHTLGAVAGTNDLYSDTSVTWNAANFGTTNAPAARSCVNMCHGDHPHDTQSPAQTTHQNNVYLDASTAISRADSTTNRVGNGGTGTQNRDSTDYENNATGGMCLSCHKNAVDATGTKPGIAQASFQSSAHNYSAFSTYGTWQYTQHDSSVFLRNCTKCHSDRGDSRTVDSTQPFGAVHYSDYPNLLAGSKSPGKGGIDTPATFVCYNCHGNGTNGVNLSGKDLASVIAKGAGSPGSAHPVNADSLHNTFAAAEATATYSSGAFAGANRHVSCLDCHSPHTAGGTKHAVGSNAVGTASPLVGATGVGLTVQATTNWPTTSTSTLYTWKTTLAYEYELCLKCHSAFAYNATPPSSPSGGIETDVARDFNTGNQSYHPVFGALPATDPSTSYGSVRLAAAQLCGSGNTNCANKDPAYTWAPGQTMYCSDCHGSDANTAGAQGPHGSAAKYLLKGPNRYWPTNSTGTTLWTVSSAGAGLFCLNCHPNVTSTNTAHSNGQHTSQPCVVCHIQIPHGGKVSRLVVTQNTPKPWNYYTPPYTTEMAEFKRAATYTGYTETGYCGGPSCYSGHTAYTGGESW